jgi:hypothetical protein
MTGTASLHGRLAVDIVAEAHIGVVLAPGNTSGSAPAVIGGSASREGAHQLALGLQPAEICQTSSRDAMKTTDSGMRQQNSTAARCWAPASSRMGRVAPPAFARDRLRRGGRR